MCADSLWCWLNFLRSQQNGNESSTFKWNGCFFSLSRYIGHTHTHLHTSNAQSILVLFFINSRNTLWTPTLHIFRCPQMLSVWLSCNWFHSFGINRLFKWLWKLLQRQYPSLIYSNNCDVIAIKNGHSHWVSSKHTLTLIKSMRIKISAYCSAPIRRLIGL